MKKLLYLLVFIVFACHSPKKQDESKMLTPAETLKQKIDQIAKNHDLMGLSLAIVLKNQTVYEQYLGFADSARKVKIDPQTAYRIASVSKTITATALLKLYEKGLFKLDEDVNKYLGFSLRNPKFPKTPITFRMLLTHTSTVNDGTGYGDFLGEAYKTDPPANISELFTPKGKFFTEDMFLDKEPNTYFSYSNPAFGIMGTLVERISKERFDIFCRKNILEPLQMKASFNIEDLDVNHLAVLYRKTDSTGWTPQFENHEGKKPEARKLDKYVVGSNGAIFSPQGGLRCSAPDLIKFMLMHANNGTYNNTQILQDSTANLMHQTHYNYDGKNGNMVDMPFQTWGLGFHLLSNTPKIDVVFETTKLIGHSGDAYGLFSGMYFDKNTKNGFVFMTNGIGKGVQKGRKTNFTLFEEEIFGAVEEFVKTYR